jgi:hypothetical protein
MHVGGAKPLLHQEKKRKILTVTLKNWLTAQQTT